MIFFDIDGTLIDHASASTAASLAFYDHFPGEINSARAEFPAAWERILDKHFDRFCRGEISAWEQRRARIREVFGRPELTDANCDERHRVFLSYYEPGTRAYSDALPCLERLAGRRLGIISNGIREQQIGKLERAGLLRYFSVFVFSEDAGLGKPAAEIFLKACRQAGEVPEVCAHIGDSLEADIVPSRALGMGAIWLNRGRAPSDFHQPAISTLLELNEALNRKSQEHSRCKSY